ncbi:hypothetical protein ACFRCX_30550 [Streptomyces sp. NPDC056652]|uniref:hypothetical protein n=1 Tax=Streptomyces sp. NPDC056652 TaxID=3345893 RepID=UPI00369F3707
MAPTADTDDSHAPDYPPKRPVSPQRPEIPPAQGVPHPRSPRGPLAGTARRGVAMRNRRCVNWPMEAAPWAVTGAQRRITDQLREWRYRPAPAAVEAVQAVVGHLVTAALGDGSRRISVHLSDQDRQLCVLVLSHQPSQPVGQAPADDGTLTRITEYPIVSSCGTDTAADGRRLWAVIDL